jgi:dihydroorotate dehydrogenase
MTKRGPFNYFKTCEETANRDSADRIADYTAGVRIFAPLADYLAVNVSSPNTPGLRALQAGDELRRLLDRVLEARAGHPDAAARTTPVLVKIAPDLDDAEIAAIAAVLREAGADGVIATNTSLWRPPGLAGRHRSEAGGLSGAPLFERSTIVLARLAVALDGALPIVGAGGVASGADAFAKIAAGASLVQLYTALVYQGLPLVADIHAHLAEECRRRGVRRLADLVGCERDAWASRPLPA